MTTQRSVHFDYPAGPDAVADLLFDPAYIRERAHACGESNVDVQLERGGEDTLHLVVGRDVPVELPAFVLRFASPSTRVVEASTCVREAGAWRVDYTFELGGMPAAVNGRARFAARDGGCRFESELEVSCRIPLVGERVESWLADQMERGFYRTAELNATALRARHLAPPPH